jgi:hypothetical protein
MTIRALPREQWRMFCAQVSHAVLGKRADIEVASPAFGHFVESLTNTLLSMSFLHAEDLILLHFDGVDYCIYRPRQLYADESAEGLISMEVIDADGVQRIILLHDPLMLPDHVEWRDASIEH